MAPGSFIRERMDRWSRDYENTTPLRRGPLDTYPFSVTSHKACLSMVSPASLVTGVFGRHGSCDTTNGNDADGGRYDAQ